MEFPKTTINNQDDLQLTLYLRDETEENLLNDKKDCYLLKYQRTSYKIRNDVLDYSDYLLQYFKTKPQGSELLLEFRYATSIKAYDTVMKLLLGFKDVYIPNEEYIQILAFIEELSNT